MRRISLIVLTVAIAFSLGACGFSNKTVQYSEAPKTIEGVSQDSYDNNLTGLTEYFKAKGYVAGDPTKMSAELIGAKEGYRYQFLYEKVGVRVELYEFDLSNLNDTASRVLNDAKGDGKITVEKTSVDAVVSDNGKFLLVYTKDKDTDEAVNREAEVIKDFKSFKN